MSRRNSNHSYKDVDQDEYFEDYGYEIKNVKRSKKKKVAKFKQYESWEEDSY